MMSEHFAIGLGLMIIGALIALFVACRFHSYLVRLSLCSLSALLLLTGSMMMLSDENSALSGPGLTAPHHTAVVKVVRLESLTGGTTSTSATLRAFLSSTAKANQKPVYQFIQRNADGSLNLGMIDGTTHVRQDATPATARIETRQCVYNSASNRSKWGPCSPAETIIHVPAGSVTQDFSINTAGH